MGESEKINTNTSGDWAPNLDLRFPPLPRTVAATTALIAQNADPPDTPALAEIVKADPVVGTAVLKRINSAYYGLRTRVVEIEKACQLLGFEEVADIVMSAGVMQLGEIFETDVQIEIFDRILELSLGSAAFNRHIAEEYDLPMKSLAFSSGLLHTVGRLVLLYNRPDEYEELWYAIQGGQPPTSSSEQVIFRTDHAELNEFAGREWNLPDETVMVIRYYLTPGHIGNRDLRAVAMGLSIASVATDHFYLNRTTGAEFTPPATLYGLARQVEVQPAKLTKFIQQKSVDVIRFIRSMMDPHSD